MNRVLNRIEWKPLADSYSDSARHITAAARERKQSGERHPIEDFLWEYYSLRPAHFEKWHPGCGVLLRDAADEYSGKGYITIGDQTSVDSEFIKERADSLKWMIELLNNTLNRPARFNCFGLHEWAMVYRLSQEEVRHAQAPLRLSPEEIAAVVEAQELKCSHYDAFRFYVPAARSLNHMVLEREDQLQQEQSGCLHANMDLYKWCYKARPIVDSELTMRCFNLAKEIRTLDMRAAPYDLTQWGLTPVTIENSEGRADYIAQQRNFSERANVLRTELRDKLTAALRSVEGS
ncbi:MAG: hypothetical protein RL410_970 [Actinomycetota bacterium]